MIRMVEFLSEGVKHTEQLIDIIIQHPLVLAPGAHVLVCVGDLDVVHAAGVGCKQTEWSAVYAKCFVNSFVFVHTVLGTVYTLLVLRYIEGYLVM